MVDAHSARRALSQIHRPRVLNVVAVPCILAYGFLAARGDLRGSVPLYLAAHGALAVCMLAAWSIARSSGRAAIGPIVLWALVFRLAAGWGGPAMSDDLYRYVWDGRVQLAGVHPYAFAPDDPELAPLRDDAWSQINHPDVKTIYPPLAQSWFAFLALLGLGPAGFQAAAGLVDFAMVCVVLALLRALRLPDDRLVLYAWNPLAILETAGSGHLEPLAVALAMLAVLAVVRTRGAPGALALGLAIQAKLLPAVLLPGMIRRMRPVAVAVLAAAIVAPALPYALTGPFLGDGVRAFAERWERNASVYAAIELTAEHVDTAARLKPVIAEAQARWGEAPLPYGWLYRHVWPREIARLTVAILALAWLVWLAFRRGLDPATESLWALGGVLVLAPVVHPWYLLWVLPLAAVLRSPGWLLWCALVPLAYLGGSSDVPPWARVLQYAPVLVVLAVESRRALRPAPRPPEQVRA